MRKLISRNKGFDSTKQYILETDRNAHSRPEQPGVATNFDGVLTHGIAASSPVVLDQDFTISFYTRLATTLFFPATVLGNSSSPQHIAFNNINYNLLIRYSGGTGWNLPWPSSYNPSGRFVNVTITRSQNTTRVYVDGVLIGSDNGTNTGTGSFEFNMIGNDSSNSYFNGVLFDIRVYTRAMSQIEIDNMLLHQTRLDVTDLLRHWRLDTNDGSLLLDSSGNNDHYRIIKNTLFFRDCRFFNVQVPFSWHNETGYGTYLGYVDNPWSGGDRQYEQRLGGLWGNTINTMTLYFELQTDWSPLQTQSHYITHGPIATNNGLNIRSNSLGSLTVSGAWGSLSTPNGIITANSYHRIAVVFTPTTQKIFVNGLLQASATNTILDICSGYAYCASIGDGVVGYIGNFKVWNNLELSDNAVRTLTAGSPIGLISPDIDIPNKTLKVPPNAKDNRLDVYNGPIIYSGPAKRDLKLVNSNCIDLNGTNQSIIFNPVLPTVGNSFCFHVRCRLDELNDYMMFSRRLNPTAAPGTSAGVQMGVAAGGTNFSFVLVDGGGGNFVNMAAVPTNIIQTDVWYSFDMVFNTLEGRLNFYIDGKLVGTSVNPAMIGANLTNFGTSVFGRTTFSNLWLNASVCDLRVYTSATNSFTDEDIEIINNGEHPEGFTLDRYLPCAEGGGNRLYDVSGNVRHADVTNGVAVSLWRAQNFFHYNITEGFNDAVLGNLISNHIDTNLAFSNNISRYEISICFRQNAPINSRFILGGLNAGFTSMFLLGTGGIPNITLSVGSGPFQVSGLSPQPNVHYRFAINVNTTTQRASLEVSINGAPYFVLIPEYTYGGNPVSGFDIFASAANVGGGINGPSFAHVWDIKVFDTNGDLIQHLPCREGSGTFLEDVSGNGNNGTLAGSINDRDRWVKLGRLVNQDIDSAVYEILRPSVDGHNGAETQLDIGGGVLPPWLTDWNSDIGYSAVTNRNFITNLSWNVNQEKLTFNAKITPYDVTTNQCILSQDLGVTLLGIQGGFLYTLAGGIIQSSSVPISVNTSYNVCLIIDGLNCKIYLDSELILDVTLPAALNVVGNMVVGQDLIAGTGYLGSIKNVTFDRGDVNIAIYPLCQKVGLYDISGNSNHLALWQFNLNSVPWPNSIFYRYNIGLTDPAFLNPACIIPFFDRIVDENNNEICYYRYIYNCYQSPRGDVFNNSNNKTGQNNQGVILANHAGNNDSHSRYTPPPVQNTNLNRLMIRLQDRFYPDERETDV